MATPRDAAAERHPRSYPPRDRFRPCFRLMQQLPHIVLPDLGHSQALVAAGLRPSLKRYGAAALHLRDGPLEAAQLERVKFIIGKIDGEQPRLDQAQPGRRIIISRCVELSDDIVGLLHFQRLFGNALDVFVCIARSRERGPQMRRAIHHELEEVPGQTEA